MKPFRTSILLTLGVGTAVLGLAACGGAPTKAGTGASSPTTTASTTTASTTTLNSAAASRCAVSQLSVAPTNRAAGLDNVGVVNVLRNISSTNCTLEAASAAHCHREPLRRPSPRC
ncbi:MAG: hypothetical protein ACRDWV_10035 [Acidimicrobiales bacterium]